MSKRTLTYFLYLLSLFVFSSCQFRPLEEMEFQTGRFLTWCLHGDTELFYSDYRWAGWRKDVSELRCDEGFAFYPFLFAKADGIGSRARRKVPMAELIGLEFDFLRQLGQREAGAAEE